MTQLLFTALIFRLYIRIFLSPLPPPSPPPPHIWYVFSLRVWAASIKNLTKILFLHFFENGIFSREQQIRRHFALLENSNFAKVFFVLNSRRLRKAGQIWHRQKVESRQFSGNRDLFIPHTLSTHTCGPSHTLTHFPVCLPSKISPINSLCAVGWVKFLCCNSTCCLMIWFCQTSLKNILFNILFLFPERLQKKSLNYFKNVIISIFQKALGIYLTGPNLVYSATSRISKTTKNSEICPPYCALQI